jgi:hypothetical protein
MIRLILARTFVFVKVMFLPKQQQISEVFQERRPVLRIWLFSATTETHQF